MVNYKEFFASLIDVQAAATVASIDAFSKFSGTDTYVKEAKTFVESSKENAKKIIEGQYFFSGSKK
jgi:hypothetical protein